MNKMDYYNFIILIIVKIYTQCLQIVALFFRIYFLFQYILSINQVQLIRYPTICQFINICGIQFRENYQNVL